MKLLVVLSVQLLVTSSIFGPNILLGILLSPSVCVLPLILGTKLFPHTLSNYCLCHNGEFISP